MCPGADTRNFSLQKTTSAIEGPQTQGEPGFSQRPALLSQVSGSLISHSALCMASTCLWILELKGSQACKGFLFNFFIVSTLPSYLASRFQPEILIVFIKILILGKRELILSFSSELDRKTEAQKKEHGCAMWNLSVYGDSAIMKLGRLLSNCHGWIDSFCPLGFTEAQRLATLSRCSKHLSDCGGSSHRAPRGV